MITRLIRFFIRLKLVFLMAKGLYKVIGDDEEEAAKYIFNRLIKKNVKETYRKWKIEEHRL